MAILNNCADPLVLEQNHEIAVREVEKQLLDAIAELNTTANELSSTIDDLNDMLTILMSPAEQDLRSDACLLPDPKNPTDDDLASMVQSQTGLNVINRKVFLPGTLDLSAVQRMYSVTRSLDSIYGLLPELYPNNVSDPVFGDTTVPTRLLIMELRYEETEEAPNPCNPDDTVVTTKETLVSIDKPVSEDSDTRHILVFWIGPEDVSDALRMRLVKLNFTDSEIADILVMKSQPGIEVYTIPDPARLGEFLAANAQSFMSRDSDTMLVSILTSETLTSVDDSGDLSAVVNAIRDVISQPAPRGCGIPASIALISILDPSSYGPSDPQSECPDESARNIFQPVNDIFGATGKIQNVINKVMQKSQEAIAKATVKLSDLISYVERYLLSIGQFRVSVGSNVYGTSSPIPGIPQPPNPPDTTVYINTIEQFVDALADRVEFIQNFITATTRIFLGVSLLACTASLFDAQATGLPPEFRNRHAELGLGSVTSLVRRRRGRGTSGSIADAFQTNVISLPECHRRQLDAQLDAHVLSFDWINQIIQQLLDIVSRLQNLIYELRQAQNSAQGVIRLQCSITETAQLAADIARRLAASNFGSSFT